MNQPSKFLKNPERGKTTEPFQPYVPEYKKHGIEPTPAGNSGPMVMGSGKRMPFAAQVLRKPVVAEEASVNKQPYAEPGPTLTVPNKGPITAPSVGSETEWFEDFSVIDGGQIKNVDYTRPMIDNNEYVSYPASFGMMPAQITTSASVAPSSKEPEAIDVFDASALNISFDQYVLIVSDQILDIDVFENIQEQVSLLVFGEHPTFKGQPINESEICVLKRLNIRVGIFLDQ